MTGQKVDKRVARTKTRLKEGLADLMTEKSIQEITVKSLWPMSTSTVLLFICTTLIFPTCLKM